MLLITGEAGFIGSNFVLDWLAQSYEPVVNLDKLPYARNLENLASLGGDARYVFVQGDLGDRADMSNCPKHQVLHQMTKNSTKSDIEVGFVNNF